MKHLHSITGILWVIAAAALAEGPEPKQGGERSALFEKLFGPNAPAQGPTPMGMRALRPAAKGEAWELYPRGGQPAGAVITPAQAIALAPGSYLGNRTYLTGQFVVTAAGVNRAVWRSAETAQSLRVVVEYPAGGAVPGEGAKVVLDPTRGLLIREVKRGVDNTVTIYAREITRP